MCSRASVNMACMICMTQPTTIIFMTIRIRVRGKPRRKFLIRFLFFFRKFCIRSSLIASPSITPLVARSHELLKKSRIRPGLMRGWSVVFVLLLIRLLQITPNLSKIIRFPGRRFGKFHPQPLALEDRHPFLEFVR